MTPFKGWNGDLELIQRSRLGHHLGSCLVLASPKNFEDAEQKKTEPKPRAGIPLPGVV